MQFAIFTPVTQNPSAECATCARAQSTISSIVKVAHRLSVRYALPSSFKTVITLSSGANFMFSAHSSCSHRCTTRPRRPVSWTLIMECSVPFTRVTANSTGDFTTRPCSMLALTISLTTVRAVLRPEGCETIRTATLVLCSTHMWHVMVRALQFPGGRSIRAKMVTLVMPLTKPVANDVWKCAVLTTGDLLASSCLTPVL